MANRITRGLGIFGRLQASAATIGGMDIPMPGFGGNVYWVDGTNGSDSYDGKDKAHAFATIQAAVTASSAGDSILIRPKLMTTGASDPTDYAETIIIPATKPGLSLIGVANGMAQCAQPQIKKGAGSTAQITVRAPGCQIANLTINGASATGGGILLDGDASTKEAAGTVIRDCHFKNCKASAAAATGGAITWSANGCAWQVRIERCHFYNCRAGIVLIGTGISVPQDVAIVNCEFVSSAKATVDADIYLAGGDGITGLVIDSCLFGTVDVPAYATSPSAARYLDLTNSDGGILSNCMFACTGKTFGAAGDAAKIPTTVRMANCHQEGGLITRT